MGKEKKDDFHKIMFECLKKREKVEGDESVTSEAVESVREKIIKKGFHARSDIAFQKYKEDHTGRFATKSGLAICQELKSVT